MKFIEGDPKKPATKRVFRAFEQVERRPLLLDQPIAQQDDPVGKGHRLDLIVGDIDHGLAELLMQPFYLTSHLIPELGIQVGKRLVEQEKASIPDDRPTDRHALALTAGQLAGKAFQQRP